MPNRIRQTFSSQPPVRPAEVELLIHSASQLVSLAGGPQRGHDLGRLGLIEDGALAISRKEIVDVGRSGELRTRYPRARSIDARGHVVMPGFVDPHTHLIWAGDRAAEFEARLQGVSYMQIMASGGGIISTVRQTREAPTDSLLSSARDRLNRMLACGTTTAEAKTGYGLELAAELRMLDVILGLDAQGPIELAPTFLGAHAVPPEYSGRTDAYIDELCTVMLPGVQRWWQENAPKRPLPFVDVFCEPGAFDLGQSRHILEAAKSMGFPLKMHADEFQGIGGTGLAVELGAASADHLVHTPEADIAALGSSDTVAVALPCTPFGLGESSYTPAQAILNAGGILALATDLNPGTAWCESMQLVLALACRYLRLTPAQAIAAATINAAKAICRDDRIGSLEPGKQADVLILDVPDYRHLGYRFGTNLVSMVLKRGKIVFPESAGMGE